MLLVAAAFEEAAWLSGQDDLGLGDWFSAQAKHYRDLAGTDGDPRLNCPPVGWPFEDGER